MGTFGRLLLMVIGALSVTLLGAAEADARRIALVIGNKGYATAVGPLRNPHNDITLVADALKAAGFEVLEPVREATRARILQAVRLFALRLQAAGPDAVGFLYYSGHGAAIGSQNYLIPVDVEKPDGASLADGGVPQREIINRLAEIAPNAVHYLVIDACRNNLGGTKGPKGFRAEDRRDGMLIAFAAAPDKPASDEGEKSGPFAAALAAELKSPERDDYLLFHRVRVAVDRATRGEQVPWIEDGMRRAERVKLGTPVVKVPERPREPVSPVAIEWRDVRDSGNRRALEGFLTRHQSDPVYGPLAEQAIAALQPPPAAPLPRPQPAPVVAAPRCSGVEVDVVGTGSRCLDPADQQRREFQDCVGVKGKQVCLPMVVLPKGDYLQGDETRSVDGVNRRKVSIGYHLAVGKFEVTFAQWDACVDDDGCKHKPETTWGRDRQPVMRVSWDDITKDYLPWLNRKMGLTGVNAYRLLTEAEWEYAARGVTSASARHTKYSFGDTITKAQAQFSEGSLGSAKQPIEVGKFPANAFGLHDMHGNMWEWVQDCYVASYKDVPTDGKPGPDTAGCSRVLRGGSWDSDPGSLRLADRGRNATVIRYGSLGFRVARSVSR